MIENILILDTETTGLYPDKGDIIIEIAAVLFNLKNKSILQCFSTLLPCSQNPVEKINHISVEATQCDYPFVKYSLAEEKQKALDQWENPEACGSLIYEESILLDDILNKMANSAQACVAHNAQFDRKFVESCGWGKHLAEKKWICTKQNFTWGVPLQRFRLQDICHAFDVPYVNAHRALADCLLLAQCFQKIDDLQERFDRCQG